jgi:type I restriction enzyme S subunit
MIELLKEKRIALITQAVTKGLDPNVPMKTSGIKWLGEVPEHWSVKRLKYLSSCNDESLPESTDPDFEMLYVDISSVTRIEGITNKEEMRFEDAPSRARRRVRDGNIIVSTVRTYLRAIAPIENAEDNLIVSTGFAVLRPVNICSDYLSLIIQSHYVVESIVARSVGVSYPAINASDIGDIRITIPPTSEQHDIVDKVRKAILQIDTLQSKNEHSITLLREYRSSLIHHAVTGKIDLRGHDAQAQ